MNEDLRSLLIENFNPNFLAYEFIEKNVLNLVMSSACFINQPMPERVRSVYACIENKLPFLLEEYVIYVNAFTDTEIAELRDYYNNEV